MTFFNVKPKAWIESTGQCSSNGAILLIYYSQSEAGNFVASKVYNKIAPLTLFPESLGEDYFKTAYKLNEKDELSA